MPEVDKLIADCIKAAEYYENAPGHAGPPTMVDLYRTIALLANIVKEMQTK